VALKKEFANLSFGIHPRAHARGPLPILIDGLKKLMKGIKNKIN